MLGFLIIFGVLFLIIGLPITLGNLGCGKKRLVKGLATTVLFIAVVSGLVYCATILDFNSDSKIWNNGQHENCGQWEMFDIERTRHGSMHYYYKCNECGKVVDLSINFTD